MRHIFLFFFCILSMVLNAQNNLNGIVVNGKDHKPVEFASVYISGTTKGTMTDSTGHFTLKNLSFPCRLVVSCVGYELRSFQLTNTNDKNLNIELREQFKQLSEISVAGKNRRKQNLELFKRSFLGDDKWGKHANLAQEDGLLFEHQSDTIPANSIFKDVETFHTFKVKTKSAVKVRLPLLGYDAYVDIVSFSVKTSSNSQTTEYDLYTRFIPYNLTTDRQRKKIENNRREVYYNSSVYFCRSLFNNKLTQNGFITSTQDGYFIENPKGCIEFDISPYSFKKTENEIAITGLKGKTIGISYFYNSKMCPVNLESQLITNGKPVFPGKYSYNEHHSTITFLSDTCIVYSDGTIEGTDIVFSGDMATYVGGRLLPLDYEPQASSVTEKLSLSLKTDPTNSKHCSDFETEIAPELKIKKISKQYHSSFVDGYSVSHSFFSPRYDKMVMADEKDYRRTL